MNALRIVAALALLALGSSIARADCGAVRNAQAAIRAKVQEQKEAARQELFRKCEKSHSREEQVACQSLYAALYIPK